MARPPPKGRQLKLLCSIWTTDEEGWNVGTYEMLHHRQEDKQLGALVQLCMARQLAPSWESTNIYMLTN